MFNVPAMKFREKYIQILLFGIFSLFSPFLFSTPAQNIENCLSEFQDKGKPKQEEKKQLSLFDNSSPSIEPPIQSEILFPTKPQNTKVEKDTIIKDFFLAFKKRNHQQIKKLVNKFPFLKEVRFESSFVNRFVEKRHLHWCPEGWSPPQLASYTKDIQILEWLLELDFNIRTKKTIKEGNIEHNPLHISIKRDFKEGAQKILAYAHDGHIPSKKRNRFIDEKNQDKETPWAMAVRQDQKKPLPVFMLIVGQYHPSGYVESYDQDGPKDGYEIAEETGNNIFIRLAKYYLVAPNYRKHKKSKLMHGRRTTAPSHPSH